MEFLDRKMFIDVQTFSDGDLAGYWYITATVYVQNLKNVDLSLQNRGGGAYSAPGGPIASTLNVSGPGDNKTQAEQPSSVASPAKVIASPGDSAASMSPQLLLNRTPDELPEGGDPSKQEVSDWSWRALVWTYL